MLTVPVHEDMVMMGSSCGGIPNENKEEQTFVPFRIHIILFYNFNQFLIFSPNVYVKILIFNI